MITIAKQELGYKAKPLHDCKYNTWYYGKSVNGSAYPWCAVFVSWCLEKSNSNFKIKTPSVKKFYKFFNKLNRIYTTNPNVGDLTIWLNPSHIGIIILVDTNGFYSVEGNCDDEVQLKFHHGADYYANLKE